MGKLNAGWYVGRGAVQPTQEETPVKLDNLTLDAFDNIIEKASLGNPERMAAATSKADYHSFLRANTWYKPTVANNKVVNRWLLSKGLTHPMYAEINDATTELAQAGLLADVDEAAFAQHLDNATPQKFTGTFTKREYTDLDTMLVQERQAVIEQQGAEKQTDQECAFEKLSADEVRQMIRDGLSQHQTDADRVITEQNGDSWVSLHPEFHDGTANAKRLALQLILNGVTGVVSIEDYEVAHRQLLATGDVRQNKVVLEKQQKQEVLDRAQHAVKNSAAFDKTTEDQMYELPLDEVRRRANGNYTGVGF
jgi:hypothetical protein